MINGLGGRITLLSGSAVMAVGYVGRVFYGDSVLAVVIGAAVVSIGSAIAYAAMPSLIMASVPITETASANGLNALLRALGTSSASAVIAAVLTSVTVTVGAVEVPALAAFQDVFWLASLASLVSCAVVWFVPKPGAEPALVDASAEPTSLEGRRQAVRQAVRQAGENSEIVVHGRVMGPDEHPIPQAVVTAVCLSGEPSDWSRADNDGAFSLALPGLGTYLLIANADGWTPRSTVTCLTGGPSDDTVVHLAERLRLTGQIRRGGAPLPGALVTLSATSGEFRASTRTDEDGRYQLRLPAPGHNVLTVLGPDTLQTRSVKIFTTTQSAVADMELPSGERQSELLPG